MLSAYGTSFIQVHAVTVRDLTYNMSDIETPDAHPKKEFINVKQYTNEHHDTEIDQPVVEVLPPDGTPDNPMDTTTDVDREGN